VLCPIAGLLWDSTSTAGIASRNLSNSRTNSHYYTGAGSCLSLI